jgi:hypothetical protein
MLKKDSIALGCILGILAPLIGLLLLKYKRFGMLSFKEVFQYMSLQPGHGMLTAGLTVSLMMNALLFTIFINKRKDLISIGIFATTLLYGIVILVMKFTN